MNLSIERQIYVLRRCGFSIKEIQNFTVEKGHRYIEYYEDEKIQERIDAFALQGIDLTDYKTSGTEFYGKWAKGKREKYNEEPAELKLSKEKAQGIKTAFEDEIGRVRSKRFLLQVSKNG